MTTLAAVVLTGGTGERLGGADKAALRPRGRPLLEVALDAVAAAAEVVVVGDPVPGLRTVREDPPGGGPGAGLLAGLDALPGARWVVVLAVDMPGVTPGTVERLRRAAEGHDGAALLGAGGRRQLAMVLDADRVRAVAPGGPTYGLPVHRLLAGLDLAEVPAAGAEGLDVDTRADLAAAAGIRVEPVDAPQWERWARLRLAALADAPEAFGSRHADWVDADEARWRTRFDTPPGTPRAAFRVGVLDGQDAGMVAVQPGHPDDPASTGWWLLSMWVAPAARGRGVTDALVEDVAAYVAAQGADTLRLHVREHNARARAAYERLGFAVVQGATDGVEERDAPPELREIEMRRGLRTTGVGADS